MSKYLKIAAFALIFLVSAFFLFYRLGDDTVTTDDTHFKNWSYVFMKEFEAGNYDRLYVTVQPGVLTIYSNIAGFKSFHFLKDKFGFFQNLTELEQERLLHTFYKIPKSLILIGLLLSATFLVSKVFGTNSALLFAVLMGLEPFVLGNSRVIQTDILPAYLVFCATLFYLWKRKLLGKNLSTYLITGLILGLANIEKASSVIALPAFLGIILFEQTSIKQKVSNVTALGGSFVTSVVVFFPAFWGNFTFSFWRLFIGSFIQGVKGLDAETFSYQLTPHVKPWYFYFRFLYNQLSEFIILGLVLGLLMIIFRLYQNFEGFNKSKTDIHKFFYVYKSYLLLFLIPLFYFVVFQAATKKGERFLLFLFPFLALYAALFFSKILISKLSIYLFISGVVAVRLFQFWVLFPDFLIYKNFLSLDKDYSSTYQPWGVGYRKLADHLIKNFGPFEEIYLGDHENLRLFYPGKVKDIDNLSCTNNKALLIKTHPIDSSVCVIENMKPESVFNPYKGVTFYIYDL